MPTINELVDKLFSFEFDLKPEQNNGGGKDLSTEGTLWVVVLC